MSGSHATGLQTIFGFFLGLMVTSFVGVGVYTFYPSPERAFRDRLMTMERQQQAIRNSKALNSLTAEDLARIQDLQNQLDRVQDESRAASGGGGVAPASSLSR